MMLKSLVISSFITFVVTQAEIRKSLFKNISPRIFFWQYIDFEFHAILDQILMIFNEIKI